MQRHPPRMSVHRILSTLTSKAYDVKSSDREVLEYPIPVLRARALAVYVSCESITPFGVPVLPEVKMIYRRDSGGTSGSFRRGSWIVLAKESRVAVSTTTCFASGAISGPY